MAPGGSYRNARVQISRLDSILDLFDPKKFREPVKDLDNITPSQIIASQLKKILIEIPFFSAMDEISNQKRLRVMKENIQNMENVAFLDDIVNKHGFNVKKVEEGEETVVKRGQRKNIVILDGLFLKVFLELLSLTIVLKHTHTLFIKMVLNIVYIKTWLAN